MKVNFSILIVSGILLIVLFPGKVMAEPEISSESIAAMFEEDKEYDENELIVKFKEAPTDAEKENVLSLIEGTEVSNMLNGKVLLVSLPKGKEPAAAAEQLREQEAIEFIQPNYKVEKVHTPGDAGYKMQWYLPKIQMPKAWDATKGTSAITVAVIDGGVQTNHPDLQGKIVSPYNVVTDKTSVPANAHGTHVAGIIAASMNKIGGTGVAPNVKIMPINVFQGMLAYDYDVAEAIIYAADKRANVVNMSLVSYDYSYLQDEAATYAKRKGVTLIAAAGNDSMELQMYPAALPSVIAVGATDNLDNLAWFSNWGNHVALVAPGQDIYSTIAGSAYGYMSGTSMAAPVVSGVAALVLSKNPLLSPDQVESILSGSSLDLGVRGKDKFYGYGRVDALKALSKTSAPMSAIASDSAFTATGANKLSVSFTAQKGATLSVYVEQTKGKTLKKLINPKKWSGGKVTAAWDGKLDSGLYASSGSYTLVAKLTNGRENVYKTKTVKLTNKVKPTIKMDSSATYSPASKKKLSVSYELNQATTITAKIYDSKNNLVKTVLSNKSITSKKNKIEWDGTNSKGKKVKDGQYKLVVSGVGANKIKAADAVLSIKVKTVKTTALVISDKRAKV